MRTFSLAEAATQIRGRDDKASREWLVRRLRNGTVPGYKAGRQWRMTEDDIAAAIEALRPRVVPSVPVGGLTRTSRRRLSA